MEQYTKTALPVNFPASLDGTYYCFSFLDNPVVIWGVRVVIVLIFAWLIKWWLCLLKKDKEEGK